MFDHIPREAQKAVDDIETIVYGYPLRNTEEAKRALEAEADRGAKELAMGLGCLAIILFGGGLVGHWLGAW